MLNFLFKFVVNNFKKILYFIVGLIIVVVVANFNCGQKKFSGSIILNDSSSITFEQADVTMDEEITTIKPKGSDKISIPTDKIKALRMERRK